MFDALREKASKGALAVIEKDLEARCAENIELFRALKPSDVQDDAKFKMLVVDPLWLCIKLQSGGTLATLQKVVSIDVESRFRSGLFHVRDELIRVDDGKVSLDPNFQEKLAPTLMQALRGSG